MSAKHLVIDGSNIATEGRSMPSLAQLESAVAEIKKDMPDVQVTVVVDATFAHRIDHSELERFEAASLEGAYVSPPAGAIGRGDAFLLRIAEKVNATVLSNDSFQEFHGEHPWLFEPGRLLGGTPVPGIGWIFVPRSPVRGPRSRVAVRDASRAKSQVERAIADAVAEVTDPGEATSTTKGRRRRGAAAPISEVERAEGPRPEAVNEPMAFISFIAEHPLGALIEGVVDSFTSHGAVVLSGAVRCYVPLSGLAEPPPRSAREVLHKGEERQFVVIALDPYRRGVELALPDVGVVRGTPSEETVLAEVAMTRPRRKSTALSTSDAQPTAPSRSRRGTSVQAERTSEAEAEPVVEAPKKPALRPRKVTGAARSESATSSTAAASSQTAETPATSRPRTRRNATTNAASADATAVSSATPTKSQGRKSTASTKAAEASSAPRRRSTKAPSDSVATPAPTRRARSSAPKAAAAPLEQAAQAKGPRRRTRSAS